MNYALTELKEQELWLYNYHSKMLQMMSKQIAASNKALSVLKKNGHKTGRLHYLTHEKYNSFTYNQTGFKIEKYGLIDLLWLSKVSSIVKQRLAENTSIANLPRYLPQMLSALHGRVFFEDGNRPKDTLFPVQLLARFCLSASQSALFAAKSACTTKIDRKPG